jgi:hypothetical protein
MDERARDEASRGVGSSKKACELKQIEAAELLEPSYRQTKRLYRRYEKAGTAGVAHGKVGRRSNRAKPVKLRKRR